VIVRCLRLQGSRTTVYRRCTHEIFAPFGECARWDGLVERVTKFTDDARHEVEEVGAWVGGECMRALHACVRSIQTKFCGRPQLPRLHHKSSPRKAGRLAHACLVCYVQLQQQGDHGVSETCCPHVMCCTGA
jgi:hypothetical protein